MIKAAPKPAAAAPAKVAGAVAKPEVNAEVVKAMESVVAVLAASAAIHEIADAIWVRTKQGVARRCRAGMVFTAVPVLLPVDDLSQDQLDAIEADPLLEAVDAPVADAANETAE